MFRKVTRALRSLALALLVLLIATQQNAVALAPEATQRSRLMVALVLGQSNAANFGETRHRSGPGVYNLYRGYMYYARDPLRGANGEGGSPWTRLGDKLIASKLYDAVIFAPAAIGATEIAKWTPDGELFSLIEKAIGDANKRKYKITHIFWHQGESDAYLHTSKKDYMARFMAMLGGIRKLGVDAPIYVSVATRCGQFPIVPEIQQAQSELANPALGIYAGPNTDILDQTYRVDGCHFSTLGLDQHAEMWFQIIKSSIEIQLKK